MTETAIPKDSTIPHPTIDSLIHNKDRFEPEDASDADLQENVTAIFQQLDRFDETIARNQGATDQLRKETRLLLKDLQEIRFASGVRPHFEIEGPSLFIDLQKICYTDGCRFDGCTPVLLKIAEIE